MSARGGEQLSRIAGAVGQCRDGADEQPMRADHDRAKLGDRLGQRSRAASTIGEGGQTLATG
jgi:hypothetical protein